MSVSPSSALFEDNEIVNLNVGGVFYTTTRTTLVGRAVEPEGTMLSAMLSSDPPAIPTRRDRDGRLFIDRDGVRFGVLLNYLRGGTITGVSSAAFEGLREEASFFGMRRLERELENEISAQRLEEEMDAMEVMPLSQGSVGSCVSGDESVSGGGSGGGTQQVPGYDVPFRKEGVREQGESFVRTALDYEFSLTEDF